MSSFDWAELIKDKKGVVTKDNQACGNIIGERGEDILVSEGAINQHFYQIPKSKVNGYDGSQVLLNLAYTDLGAFEDKGKGTIASITDSLKDTGQTFKQGAGTLKENTVDRITNRSANNNQVSDETTSGTGQEREYEEGGAGTEPNRQEDPLTEYRDKEAMTPAKIKEHEPTAVKREMTEKIVEPGQEGTDSEKAKEIARRSGMAKGTAGASDTGNEYEQGVAGSNQ